MAPRKFSKATTARLCVFGDVRVEHLDQDENVVESIALSNDASRLLVALATVKRARNTNDLITKITGVGPSEDSGHDEAHRKRLQNAASAARKALGPASANLPHAGRRDRYELKRDERLATDFDEDANLQAEGQLLDALDRHCSGPIAANLDDRWLEGVRTEQRAAIKSILERLHQDRGALGAKELDGLVDEVLDGETSVPEIEAAIVDRTDDVPMLAVAEDSEVQPNYAEGGKPENPGQSRRHAAATDDELNLPFFERTTTDQYLTRLAASPALTVFAGAGVSADVGLPLHEDLFPAVLRLVAENHRRDLGLTNFDESERRELLDRAIDRVHQGSSSYLGSIAREIVTDRNVEPYGAREHADERLQDALRLVNTEGRFAGGFLARGVGALTFYLQKAGKSAQIITTNYDSVITDEAQDKLHTHIPTLKPFWFSKIVWPRIDGDQTGEQARQIIEKKYRDAKRHPKQVPLYYANGKLDEDGRLIVGEYDFFPNSDGGNVDRERQNVRTEIIESALKDSDCLFVGSSVTDPDMLSRLANTDSAGSGQRRYALVLAPKMDWPADLTDEGAVKRAEAEYRLARRLTAERFRHLRVEPIMVDFPCQVPQLLREVGLKARQGRQYRSYKRRLDHWWKVWHETLGFSRDPDSEPGPRSPLMQWTWRNILAKLRDDIGAFAREHSERTDDPERLMLELWLRNPHSRKLRKPERDVRGLFLWATSESLWLEGDSAHWGPITFMARDHYLAQTSFREGRTITQPLNPERGHWKYAVSMPLVLHKRPWYHLPVGVVNVLSDSKAPRLDATGNEGPDDPKSPLYYVTRGNSSRQRYYKHKTVSERSPTLVEAFEDKVKVRLNKILATEKPEAVLKAELAVAREEMRSLSSQRSGARHARHTT